MQSWDEFYDQLYAELFLKRSDEELKQPVDFLKKTAGIAGPIFDQGCGIGSLSGALARNGSVVVGVDRRVSYVSMARSDNTDCPAYFAAADYSRPVFAPETFGSAVNWWTSFGHSPDDATNQAVLNETHRVLKQKGLYVLDYSNMARLHYDFERKRQKQRTDDQGRTWTVTRETELTDRMTRETWTLQRDDQTITRTGGIRRYEHEDLKAMLNEAGFECLNLYGDYHGSDYDEQSAERCIVVAQKA